MASTDGLFIVGSEDAGDRFEDVCLAGVVLAEQDGERAGIELDVLD